MRHLSFFFFLFPILLTAQVKEYPIDRAENTPKVDGVIEVQEWGKYQSAGEFISYYPISGAKMLKGFKTEWKAIYDNKAIYFAITMLDPSADSIMTQLCKRDEVDGSNNDNVLIRINPYQDGQTDFGFRISPLGVQEDIKFSLNNEDSNWDMVWKSASRIDEKGWYAEFEILILPCDFPNLNFKIGVLTL